MLASAIISETRDVSRFKDKNGYAKYNGTSATQDSSGKRKKWVATKWCNRRLKVAFYQLALSALRLSPISKGYYQSLIKCGFNKQKALKRLSDIIFAMLRDNSEYDPSRFLKKEGERWQV